MEKNYICKYNEITNWWLGNCSAGNNWNDKGIGKYIWN